MSRWLWLVYLPLLFLPNMGMERQTPFGTLQISDYLMVGYLLIVTPAAIRRRVTRFVDGVAMVFLLFVIWALFSTGTINARYSYYSASQTMFSLLKLAKFTMYFVAGLLTVRAYEPRYDLAFHWSLLGVGLITGIAIWMKPGDLGFEYRADAPYAAANAISVAMAILVCYLLGRYVGGYGSRCWRRGALIAAMPIAIGFLLTEGRGGWLSAGAGIVYYLIRHGILRRFTVRVLIVLGCVIMLSYWFLPPFREQVDKTLYLNGGYVGQYPMARIGGIDTGGRISIWISEGAKLVDAPLIGTGFFHRGGLTRLAPMGSHNFFLQMFLELGIPGGLLALALFAAMWVQAGRLGRQERELTISVRAALIAAIVGGLGGEYYYGGLVLFMLLLVYTPIGGGFRQRKLNVRDGLGVLHSLPQQRKELGSGASTGPAS